MCFGFDLRYRFDIHVFPDRVQESRRFFDDLNFIVIERIHIDRPCPSFLGLGRILALTLRRCFPRLIVHISRLVRTSFVVFQAPLRRLQPQYRANVSQ